MSELYVHYTLSIRAKVDTDTGLVEEVESAGPDLAIKNGRPRVTDLEGNWITDATQRDKALDIAEFEEWPSWP